MSFMCVANDLVMTFVDLTAGQTFAKELKSVSEIVLTDDTAFPCISLILLL